MPLLISEDSRHRGALTDLAVDLSGKAAGFRSSLAPGVRAALADLVRSMNCYYSNLIEGHDTHPIDIERALKDDYSTDNKKRDLQLEAKAHIAVQRWIDEGHLKGRTASASGSAKYIVASASFCPTTCSGSRNLMRVSACASFRANSASAT